MTRDDYEYSLGESSPDPLAGDMDLYARKTTTGRSSKPRISTSPNKQNRQKSTSELGISSPSKSIVMSTPRAGGASPWRIKVTVQAEPGSGDEDSPVVKRVTRTQTTTIPLKDPDVSSPAKRRGRPRKSDTTSAKSKRSGTPVKRTPRAKSKKRDTSTGADTANVDTDGTPKKRRGRPRKSIPAQEKATEEEQHDETDTNLLPSGSSSEDQIITPTPDTKDHDEVSPGAAEDDPFVSEAQTGISQRIRTRRGTPAATEKSSIASDGEPSIPIIRKISATPQEQRQIKPPQSIRARKGTPVAKGQDPIEISSGEDSDDVSDMSTPAGSDEDIARTHAHVEDAAVHDFGPSYAPSDDDYEQDELQDMTGFAFDEGVTRGPEDTTVIDSEQFSMISVDSLPSSGGLTSPVMGSTGRSPTTTQSAREPQDLLPVPAVQPRSVPQEMAKISPGPAKETPSAEAPTTQTSSDAAPRYITPSMDNRSPSQPPPIEAVHPTYAEAETPKIGRVVKAGVALQGLLDPSRMTPEPGPSKTVERRLSDLDDLFRGFSEGTRKELQAGLHLGERLARENKGSPVPRSSPITQRGATKDNGDVFSPETRKSKQRLLTPEEQENDAQQEQNSAQPIPLATQTADVQYPTLNPNQDGKQLPTPTISPARSEDEMNWKVDPPLVNGIAAAGGRFMTVTNEKGEVMRGKDLAVVADQADEGYDDLWQEEAGRSSPIPNSQDEDIFALEGRSQPGRGKLPRNWRRKSPVGSGTKSDEASSQQRISKGKGKATAPVEDEYNSEYNSEASDDTGMFFATNLPNVYSKGQPLAAKKRKSEKLDLSSLMHEGVSLIPDSSPPVVSKTSGIIRPNPFIDTPPRFAGFQNSPAKSSPLRKEIRASPDTSTNTVQQGFEESELPLAPSSPFHTQVDGVSISSTASDQRQLMEEMAANQTDPSLRNIRNEADGYLDAYELQDRSLGEIEEVTEVSRTFSKPPNSVRKDTTKFEESMVNAKRVPLFNKRDSNMSSTPRHDSHSPLNSSSPAQSVGKSEPARKVIAIAPPQEERSQPSTGLFSRLASTFFGSGSSTSNPSAPPAPPSIRNHPIVFSLDQLPAVEPWTKTHYKILDYLFQLSESHPMLFSPSTESPHHTINAALLDEFLEATGLPYVDAIFSSWGYSFQVTEAHVVLCAVFCQLMTLEDAEEYEEKTGRPIDVGDCGPGPAGENIGGEEVMRRFATVVIGERLRRDEKRGKVVKREGGLRVRWPGE